MRDYKSKTRASYVACVGKAGADTYYDKFTSPNCPNSKLIKKHNLAVWHSGGGFFSSSENMLRRENISY